MKLEVVLLVLCHCLVESFNITSGDEDNVNMTDNRIRPSGLILGLYDTLTNLTKDVAGIVGEVEDELGQINRFDNVTMKTSSNSTESSAPSPFVTSLFGAIEKITGGVGTLISGVGHHLSNKRGHVKNVAQHVHNKVDGFGTALKNWVGSLEDGVRNISLSLNRTTEDGEVIQIANYTSFISISSVNDTEDTV